MTETADLNLAKPLLRKVASELALTLTNEQIQQLAIHFSLLLQWSRKVNLTSLCDPAEIARRHFGESLYLAKILPAPSSQQSLMIDVGSGAGFPGLPLKVAWSETAAVLLEPNRKKAAFLKEVIRRAELKQAEVRTERLEEASRGELRQKASLVTMRAVAGSEELLENMRNLLRVGGQIALFLGAQDAANLAQGPGFMWDSPILIPGSQRRVILLGHLAN